MCDDNICLETAARGRRLRLIKMTDAGRHVWLVHAQPKIYAYYEQALDQFSIGDITHTLHYLLKLLDNMQSLDHGGEDAALAPQDGA